jgi:hypothetical protein
MTERYGYGYGDEPSGQGPVSGRGAVTEREAAKEGEPPEQAGERVVDLTDQDRADEDGDGHDERMREAHEEEAPPAEPPGSGSVFEPAVPVDAEPAPAAPVDAEPAPAAPVDAEAAPAAAPADLPAAEREPVVVEAAPEPAAAELGPAALLSSIDADDVRRRFLDIQAGFVDEPRQAVEDAGRFVDDLVQQVIEALASQRGQLQSPVTDDDTEQLRQALRGYRQFVDRLLGLAL